MIRNCDFTSQYLFNSREYMWVTTSGIVSAKLSNSVVERVLNIYPEEKLMKLPVFQKAFNDDLIDFSDLKYESEKILIPWQMFFLNDTNLKSQIKHINDQRQHKVSLKLLAKRRGLGDTTSKRIIDRLIRQQNFLIQTGVFPENLFCGSLKKMQATHASKHILNYFGISRAALWRYKSKGVALEYIIKKVESMHINVSRGVLVHKLLPNWQVVPTNIYKNTSGFVIKDWRIPFIFLPNEINIDEVESRQIYTLVYLLAVIGLEQYDYYIDKDFKTKIFKTKMMNANKIETRLHEITTELLIPRIETNNLIGQKITLDLRDSLAQKFKVSPSALVVTLKLRGIISKREYELLKPPAYVSQKNVKHFRSPKVSTAVKKFCGENTFNVINTAIKNRTLSSVQAQYLIWGAVNKKGYHNYRNELGI